MSELPVSLDKPNPPIVGKVTHYSVELYWQAMKVDGHKNLKYVLQEAENDSSYGTVYSNAARVHTAKSLEPQTQYKYRVRVMCDDAQSEWSQPVSVTTTKKPITGDDLHKAVASNDCVAINTLLQDGRVPVDVPGQYGMSPLMVACQKGFENAAACLIQKGADVNYKNESGKDGLMVAATNGFASICTLLMQNGAEVNSLDRGGGSPLHFACDGGHISVVKLLIKAGASIEGIPSKNVWPPLLRVASVSGNAEVANVLIENGADTDYVDHERKTLLMVAALNGFTDLCQTLIEHGVNMHAENSEGHTALDLAKSFNRRPVVELLHKKMFPLDPLENEY
eukprot:Nk52_evm90s1737 gene=Nk52_evmTU90s1737